MNILDIIEKKRDKKELTKEEIEYFIKEYTNNNIADYQMASLIMAIYLNGMTNKEIADLTLAMAHSGEILDLSVLKKPIIDKHSTGGVGDKVSLVLLPLIASLGIPVAKMSGRGLGFTGGTIDKLESIPGYQTNIDINKFVQNVDKIGISIISQTLNLAPADKKIYALRDSIACVESIPLIASSIMSKKIASGAKEIVLDVTVGSGAFMENKENAEKLAMQMVDIGEKVGRKTVCLLTNMDEPLGYAVGNTLEVIEAINFLKGEKIKDLEEIVLQMGYHMLLRAGEANSFSESSEKLLENIKNGKAYNKFIELVENQGGDISYIENTSKFEKAKYIEPVYAKKSGYVTKINAKEVGKLACYLGAGRIKKEDRINPRVGIVLNKKVCDKIKEKEILGYIHSDDKERLNNAIIELEKIMNISDKNVEQKPMLLGVVNNGNL